MTPQEVASAYDGIATEYDRYLEGDQWMRRVLWAHYARLFRPGHRVLDVACGTGTDALFLARVGIHVVGIDASHGMIEQMREKVAWQGMQGRVDAEVMDLANLACWPPESFDGVVSAFAGLNATPDLAPFAADVGRLVRPGGRLVLHLLSRCGLWERLGLLARGRWVDAARLGGRRERDFMIGGRALRHYLYLPEEAYRCIFAPHFLLKESYSLGCLRPPHTVRRVPPPMVEALGRVEQWVCSHQPFLDWGRFFVLDMEKRDGPP